MERLEQAIGDKNIGLIKEIMATHNLIIEGGILKPRSDPETKAQYEFWDQRQYVRKILLNSLYGALLNKYLRFYDQRIGQSVTLTGRNIARHMSAKINEIVAGEYDPTGAAIVYGDTDSSYFSAVKPFKDQNIDFDWTSTEDVIELYDSISNQTNDTFAGFMNDKFNIPNDQCVIAAGREIVGSSGLFVKKKRYAVMVVDDEGNRKDINGKPGKLKAMGLEIKRSDTPITIQQFLEGILSDVLTTGNEDEIIQNIKDYRMDFRSWPAWEKGTPKKVNALSDYMNRIGKESDINTTLRLNAQLAKTSDPTKRKELTFQLNKMSKKVMVPGHVRASINWNTMRELEGDRFSMPIVDGQKIVVCKLKTNVMNMSSIAYPTDEPHIPAWFKKLPFDEDLMEDTLITKKIENLIGVLHHTNGWDLSKSLGNSTFDDLFG